MSRLRAIITVDTKDSNRRRLVGEGATVSLFVAGTVTTDGASVSGTQYDKPIYAAATGGSPISPLGLTVNGNGQVTVWADDLDTYDVGYVVNGVAGIRQGESFELAPPDVEIIAAHFHVERNSLGYRLEQGSGASLAAANTTALKSLHAAAATTGGTLHFGTGSYALNECAFTDAVPSGTRITWEGAGRNGTTLRFYGNAPGGGFLNFSPSSGSLQRWKMKGFLILHDSLTTGTAIRLSSSNNYVTLEEVEVAADHFLGGISAGVGVDFILERCKITTRRDYATLVAGGLTPVALDINNTFTMGGLYLRNTELSAVQKDSNPAGLGIVLRFNNTGVMDTVVIGDGCHLIGGSVNILKNSGTGTVANLLIGKAFLADCETNIQLEPPTGADSYNWFLTGTWLAGRNRNVLVSKANGGTPSNLNLTGCYLTDATVCSTEIGAGVNSVELVGNKFATSINTATRSGVIIGDNVTPSETVTMVGNTVIVGGSADQSYLIGSAVDAVTVAYNTTRGKVGSFVGATSASRVHIVGAHKA